MKVRFETVRSLRHYAEDREMPQAPRKGEMITLIHADGSVLDWTCATVHWTPDGAEADAYVVLENA